MHDNPYRAEDAQAFFTARARTYAQFIRLFRYQQGLQAAVARSGLLQPGMRVLEAGCGTGALTLAFHEAMSAVGLSPVEYHAFDLTPAMMELLRESLAARGVNGVELKRANVLSLDTLPADWRDYNLVLTASMLEYVPREQFPAALAGLRQRITAGGHMLLFVTRDNWLMQPLIGRWWRSNLYTTQQLRDAFASGGFADVRFLRFSFPHWHLAPWGHIVRASQQH